MSPDPGKTVPLAHLDVGETISDNVDMPRQGKGIHSAGNQPHLGLSTSWQALRGTCQRTLIAMEPISSLAVCSCNHLKAVLFRRISGVRLVKAYSTSR